MLDIMISNAILVTVNKKRDIIYDGTIAIKDGRIIDLGPTSELSGKYSTHNVARTMEAAGKVIFPGLINTHNHLFQTLLKGLGDDRVLSDWLVQVMFPSAAKLTPDETYYGAMIGCIEGLHSGATTVLDYMHTHPVDCLADGVIKAFNEIGMRGILGRGYSDTGEQFGTPGDVIEQKASIEKDCRRLLEKYHGTSDGRIKVWLAPAAVWSCTRETLQLTKMLADEYDTGIAVHVSETPFDREASRQLHGKWDIDVLEDLGIIGPNVLMVHCVHLTPRDIRMTKYFDAKVSHNPVSNMYLSSGIAPIPQLLETGVTVSLATDGAASNNSNDMLEVLKAAALLQKVYHRDPTIITAEKVLEMATIDGARAIGMEDEIGSLEIGKKADMFIFNPLLCAKAVPMHHPVSTLVYSAGGANIETVIIDGKIVLDGGQITAVNEREVLTRAQQIAEDLSERAQTKVLKYRPWRSIAY
ncbi:MAG: amidohydrolase [Bacillota bacterium]